LAKFGASDDLVIYHDGTNSRIKDAGTGNLYLSADADILITNSSGNEQKIKATSDGSVILYYDNASKLSTAPTGIDVTGVITTDGLTTSADISFGDNDKAKFGAGSDLQIYHNGSNSYISDSGTGDLNIRGTNLSLASADAEYFMRGIANSYVKLYHDNNEKLATTSTGVSVTGTVAATAFTGDGSSLTGIEGVPSGIISMWSGSAAAIPSGWNLCNGANGTPNLVGKFIKSASTAGGTGGSNTHSHAHSLSAGSHTLSTAQMPRHNHSGSAGQATPSGDRWARGWSGSAATRYTSSTGSSSSHSHSLSGSITSGSNEPAYFELCYIMKA
jgi:hypothetical protein